MGIRKAADGDLHGEGLVPGLVAVDIEVEREVIDLPGDEFCVAARVPLDGHRDETCVAEDVDVEGDGGNGQFEPFCDLGNGIGRSIQHHHDLAPYRCIERLHDVLQFVLVRDLQMKIPNGLVLPPYRSYCSINAPDFQEETRK